MERTYILCELRSRTYLAEIKLSDYKSREVWDNYSHGFYGWQPKGHDATTFKESDPLKSLAYAQMLAERYAKIRRGIYVLVEYDTTSNRLLRVAKLLTKTAA